MQLLPQHKIGKTIYVGITPPSTAYGVPRLQIKILVKVKKNNMHGKMGSEYTLQTHLPHGYAFIGDPSALDTKAIGMFVETLNEIAPDQYPELTFVSGYWKGFTPTEDDETIAILLLNGDELFKGSLRRSDGDIFPQETALETIFDYDVIQGPQRDIDFIEVLKKAQKLISHRLMIAA